MTRALMPATGVCDACDLPKPNSQLHDADSRPFAVGFAVCVDCLNAAERPMKDAEPQEIPNGADVILTDDFGKRWRTRTRSCSWTLFDGTRVQMVEGIVGGYLVERLQRGLDPSLPHFSERLTQQSRPKGVPW